MSFSRWHHLILVFTMWLVSIDGKISAPLAGGADEREAQDWVLNTTADTLDDLMQEGHPHDADGVGRIFHQRDKTTTGQPPKHQGGNPTPAGPGRADDAPQQRRPDYFLTVTVPWTVGMLTFLVVFLYAMRTDGCVYRRLTHSYTPPAARQQLAEEVRRERLEETQRTATTAWESERARWRSQRSPHPDASTTHTVSSSSSGPAPSVSWAQSATSGRDRPAPRGGQGQGAR